MAPFAPMAVKSRLLTSGGRMVGEVSIMTMRFKLFGTVFMVLAMVVQNAGMRPFGNFADVFIGLGAFLVLAVIIMWPNPGRTDRIDRAVDGRSWADKIEFDRPDPAHDRSET